MQVTAEVFVDRPPEWVFEFVSNFENNPRWQGGMVEARWLTPPPLVVGSQYEQVAKFLGRRIVSTFEVVALEPGRLVKATTIESSFPITFTRRVEPEGTGSRVSALVEGDASGFFRIAEPVLRWLVERSVRADYARLKELLEGAGVLDH